MATYFISSGMDIGTTNSSIAVMTPQGPRVIKIRGEDIVMPSVVYEDRNGRPLVGKPAYNAMMSSRPEDGIGHTGFKIRMGYDDRYPLPQDKALSPQELTSRIIKELWSAYLQENHLNHKSCVITVPAIFRDPACKATMEAARLAGLEFVTTLMEPVAAATAYGFATKDKQAKWIIFDIGGGTLDISLVLIKNGSPEVPRDGNTGNDLLGGRKFDRELMDYVLGPKKSDPDYKDKMQRYRELNRDYHPLREQYDLENFSRETRHGDWGRLMMAVERAKIELSAKTDATVEIHGEPLKDMKGKEIKVEFPLSRTVFERLIRPDVETAVIICEQMLRRNKLKPSDIQRLVLIGGPSKTPFIQQVLRERLGIPLETSIDPMTAVAQGAAIYADTVEVPGHLIPRSVPKTEKSGDSPFQLKLTYERNSSTPIANVTGNLDSFSQSVAGFTVKIKRKDGGWSSDAVPLDESGFFTTDIQLFQDKDGKPALSEFQTLVLDAGGQPVLTVEDPRIWYPASGILPTLPSNLMIGVENNMTHLLLEKGTDLPAEKTDEFETTRRMEKGSSGCALVIPVYESVEHFLGEVDPHSDCNLKVGELRISATEIPYDLPAGSKVDITLYRDRDRQIRVQAYVHLLDREFEAKFDSKSADPSVEEMEKMAGELQKRLQKIERLQKSVPLSEVAQGLSLLSRMKAMEQIRNKLQGAREGDKECQSRCHGDIVRMTGALNHLQMLQTEARIRHRLILLKSKVHGNTAEQLQVIAKDFEEALRSGDRRMLARLETALNQLFYQVYLKSHTDLWTTLLRFPNHFRGTQEMIDTYKHGEQVFMEVDKRIEDDEEVTDSDLRRCKEADDAIWKLWMTELKQWPPVDFSQIGEHRAKPTSKAV